MFKFTTDSTRPIIAESRREAAEIAAGRLARKGFGKNGRVGALREDGWNSMMTRYQAFIGRRTAPNQISGHNVWITVYSE